MTKIVNRKRIQIGGKSLHNACEEVLLSSPFLKISYFVSILQGFRPPFRCKFSIEHSLINVSERQVERVGNG